MNETQWDIKEVKRLIVKELVQYNLFMLFIFLLLSYISVKGTPSLLFWVICVICVILWIITAISLYTLKTERSVGTKTSKRVQAFNRNRWGEKRWKRRKVTGTIIFIVISIFITVLLFVNDLNSVRLDFPISALPFIGAWIGANLGEIIRMNNL